MKRESSSDWVFLYKESLSLLREHLVLLGYGDLNKIKWELQEYTISVARELSAVLLVLFPLHILAKLPNIMCTNKSCNPSAYVVFSFTMRFDIIFLHSVTVGSRLSLATAKLFCFCFVHTTTVSPSRQKHKAMAINTYLCVCMCVKCFEPETQSQRLSCAWASCFAGKPQIIQQTKQQQQEQQQHGRLSSSSGDEFVLKIQLNVKLLHWISLFVNLFVAK